MSTAMAETISLLPPPVRRRFEVTSERSPPVRVRGTNWLHALSTALPCMGVPTVPDRLATETLANGTVIVRDMDRGGRFVVRPL